MLISKGLVLVLPPRKMGEDYRERVEMGSFREIDAVIQAMDGPIGLMIAEKAEPDLIILDIKMPGMDGYETCRGLKRIPALRCTPVVFMSGISELSEKVEAFSGHPIHFKLEIFLKSR